MITPLVSILAFSFIAALAVAWTGRRGAAGSDLLSGLALVILLALPSLALLPGWAVLPGGSSGGSIAGPSIFAWLLPAGMLIGLIRLIRSSLQMRRWVHTSTLLASCLTPGGRRVEIRCLPDGPGPCAVGIRRPVILVPPQWTSLPPGDRRMVLAHEIAHHERRDPLWRWLGALACAVHWFNPFVWWLARRHVFHAELACDAAVLATGAPPSRYAHLLCDLAQGRTTPLAVTMNGSTLGKRVGSLQRPAVRLSRTTLTISIAGLLTAGLACGLSRPVHSVPASEIHLRLSADPFPGDS